MKRNIAVILANGKGLRAGGDIPKQFASMAGKTVLEHSITAFQDNQYIHEITIVTNLSYTDRLAESVQKHRFTKVTKVIAGGQERYLSTLAALKCYDGIVCNLLIHDAVRPLVTQRIIDDVVCALQTYHAVNVAVPATDTIIEVDRSKQHIFAIPDRSFLYMVQTPQGFDRQILQRAFDIALQDPLFQTTDDCSIVKKYLPGEKIKIVLGDNRNIKLTWPEDFRMAENLMVNR